MVDGLDEVNTSDFSNTLRSMDDQSFVRLVRTSFGGDGKQWAASTPTRPSRQCSIRSSVSHDPFDDSLDEVLLGIDVPKVVATSSESILQCAQQVADTDNDEEPTGDIPPSGHLEAHPDGTQSDPDSDSQTSEADESVGKLHKFGDYETYFENKRAKQQLADRRYLEWEKKRAEAAQSHGAPQHAPQPVFAGCKVFVNGHTVPSINEIHRLVVLHGGIFISYLTNKGAATHIVCDRLTPRKRIQFKNYKVVKAQWIVDCVERQETLNWADYRLIEDVDYGQQRLDWAGTEAQVPAPASGPLVDDTIPVPKPLSSAVPDKIQSDIVESPDDSFEIAPLSQSQHEQDEDDTLSQSGALHVESINAQARGYSMDARHPDFLQHFFAYSRLHHLSSWKADLRAQFLKKVMETPKSQPVVVTDPRDRVIMHADFDCFFASASALNRPDVDINTTPVAVSHGGKTSDVASCNYVAREFGVRNGMWMGQAKKLCPDLVMLDYDFDAYAKFSGKLYDYLIEFGAFDSIFPVSIDEVLLDATSFVRGRLPRGSREEVANLINETCHKIRKDIFDLTRCTISIGVSKNVLLAKLCLRKAKPKGQFVLDVGADVPDADQVLEGFLNEVSVRDLPGIGKSIVQKLGEEINVAGESTLMLFHVRALTLLRLQNILGEKTGTKLYQYSRGLDDTSIDLKVCGDALRRKSVSVDVNYGIRFDKVAQLDVFFIDLARELHRRLVHLTMCGSSITLRLAKRVPSAPVDPPKYLGMGQVTFVNKTAKFGVPTNDWGIVGSELKALYRMLNVPVQDLRGIAITMSNLVDIESMKKNRQRQLPFRQNEGHILDSKTIEPKAEDVPQMPSLDIDWDVFNELPPSIKAEFIKRQKMRDETYIDTSSYDEAVINELPSSIRKEVLKDLELKVRFKEQAKQRTADGSPLAVTSSYIQGQRQALLLRPPQFQRSYTSLADITQLLRGWIASSLLQGGPHIDDVLMVADYFEELLQQDDLTRSVDDYIDLIRMKGTNDSKSKGQCHTNVSDEDDGESFFEDDLEGFSEAAQSEDKPDPAQLEQYGLIHDCPVFPFMAEYVQLVAGSTVSTANYVVREHERGNRAIGINWYGGRHHSHKEKAAGFCYVNDIVLGINRLRMAFPKVFYLDLDLHHGDGVEAAFKFSSKVVTCSVHRFDVGFFPGTGGKTVCSKYINVPTRRGLDDVGLQYILEKIVMPCLHAVCPAVLVLQLGSDGLALDPHKEWNFTIEGLTDNVLQILSAANCPTMISIHS
ncbi:DNA repair protein REV1 [[Candida] zeylanoides]